LERWKSCDIHFISQNENAISKVSF
jgi:hypothetical protein